MYDKSLRPCDKVEKLLLSTILILGSSAVDRLEISKGKDALNDGFKHIISDSVYTAKNLNFICCIASLK